MQTSECTLHFVELHFKISVRLDNNVDSHINLLPIIDYFPESHKPYLVFVEKNYIHILIRFFSCEN